MRQLPLLWYFRTLPEAKTAASAVVILFSYGQNWEMFSCSQQKFYLNAEKASGWFPGISRKVTESRFHRWCFCENSLIEKCGSN